MKILTRKPTRFPDFQDFFCIFLYNFKIFFCGKMHLLESETTCLKQDISFNYKCIFIPHYTPLLVIFLDTFYIFVVCDILFG